MTEIATNESVGYRWLEIRIGYLGNQMAIGFKVMCDK